MAGSMPASRTQQLGVRQPRERPAAPRIQVPFKFNHGEVPARNRKRRPMFGGIRGEEKSGKGQ